MARSVFLVFGIALGAGCIGQLPGDGTGSGTPGAAGTGMAGTVGRGGMPGRGGTTGSAGSGGSAFGQPPCLSSVTKGGACTASDQQLCYKTCGPEKTGFKSEMCTSAGTYAEMSGCSFDSSKDYSCYKIPTAANAQCPAGVTPQGSAACDVPHCVLCNSLGGVVGGQYNDSSGAPKVGWCTCQEPNSAGMRTWTCASDTAWPCPLGKGCLAP